MFGSVNLPTSKCDFGRFCLKLVAVKQLDKHGQHGNKEFQDKVLSLSKFEHPNLVKLIGYCCDGDQRLLVFEFVSGDSLQDHLYELKPTQKPMDWITRMKIAFGAAQGLDYFHNKLNPPLIYRDLKASNILLDGEFYPKLCDISLHNLNPGKVQSLYFSSHTSGYSAPEYAGEDDLTVKSDVYSFGVVLLELITGKKAVNDQNLVSWAQRMFKDPTRYPEMADPNLRKKFSERGLNQAIAITSMCLQDEVTARPFISDVMIALSFLSMSSEDGIPTGVPSLSVRHGSSSVTPFSLPCNEEEDDESRRSQHRRISSGFSESESERRSSIDERNATAQSLRINYSYSSEEEDDDESSSLRFDNYEEDEEEEVYETQFEQIHKSESEIQSVYSDEDAGDGDGEESDGSSLQRIESEKEKIYFY